MLELNEKEKLINLLREVEADDKAKSVIANYIKSVWYFVLNFYVDKK